MAYGGAYPTWVLVAEKRPSANSRQPIALTNRHGVPLTLGRDRYPDQPWAWTFGVQLGMKLVLPGPGPAPYTRPKSFLFDPEMIVGPNQSPDWPPSGKEARR